MTILTDDVGQIAAQYRFCYAELAQHLVEDGIKRATEAGDWDEVQKWHQVRLRLRRLLAEDGMESELSPAEPASVSTH